MSYLLSTFDPTSASTGTFNTLFPTKTGKIVVYNQSYVNLMLQWAGNAEYVPAQTAVLLCIANPTTQITWSQVSSLAMHNPPVSQVQIVGYGPNEPVLGTYPAPILGSVNSGNNVGAQGNLQIATSATINGGSTTFGGVAGLTTYLVGFELTASVAGAAAHGLVTFTGFNTTIDPAQLGLNYELSVATAQLTPPIIREFVTPLPGLPGQPLTVTCANLGTSVVAVNVYFYNQ